MKNLITYLKTLWGAWGNLQSNDAICDRRLTVGSPSGFNSKLMLKLVSVLVLILTIGVGNVWGQEYETAYTLSCSTSGSNNSYTGNCDITVSDITWNVGGNSQQNPWRYGGKSLSKQNRYLYSKTAISDDITKIDIAFGANSGSITVNSVKLEVYSTAALAAAHGTGDVSSTTISYSASTTRSVTVPAGKSWQGRYYGITMNLTVSGNSNKYITISSITFYKNKAAATPTLTVSKSSISGLTYVQGSGPSTAQTFTVSGSNLTSNVTVTAPTNFEVSKDGSSYAGSQTITASGTLSATTIYVRLKSGLAVNSYSGNITVASTGATSKTVSLSGSVTAPAYTVVWTINPAAGGTLSATSGTSTIVTPNAAYTYGSPAYTVTSGSATVSQSTNTFTATPTSDCTIRINMVEKPKFTVTLKDDNSTLTQVSYGATVTLPTRTGCTGYTFAGWTKTWGTAQTEWTTTAPTIIPAGSYTPSANENLYPVYTKTEGGGSTPASITLLPSDFGSSYPSGAQGSGTITKGDYSFTYGQYTRNQNGTPSQWCAGQLIQARCTLNIGLWNTTAMDITSVVLYKASPTSGSSTWAVYEGTASAKPTAGAISVSTGSASSITADKYENKSCSSGALTGMTETPLTYTASSGCKYINIAPTNGTSYFTKIVINYTETGGSTTSYISVPSCGAVYDLTFKEWDGGGTASGDPSTGTVTANATSFSFGATPPSKDGYQIEGFYTNTSASSGVKVANSDRTFIASIDGWTNSSSEYTKAANANLYIKWTAAHYTITYNAGEHGTGSIADGDKTHGEDFTLSVSTFSRTGYTQDGWSTSDGGDKVYDLGGTYEDDADLNLYPHWVINNYTVSWMVNGSSWTTGVSASNNNADYNTTVSAPTAPESSDCDGEKVFVGWTTDDDYEHASSAPGDLFTSTSPAITANTTFYAVFAEESPGVATYTKVTTISAGTYLMATTTNAQYIHQTTFAYAGKRLNEAVSPEYVWGDTIAVGISTGVISTKPANAKEITVTLGTGDDAGYFSMYDGEKYLKMTTKGKFNFSDDIAYDWELNGSGYIHNKGEYDKVSTWMIILNNGNSGDPHAYFVPMKDKDEGNNSGSYYYHAFLFKKEGGATYSNYAVSCGTCLAAPNPITINTKSTSATLSWPAVSGATGYTVTCKQGSTPIAPENITIDGTTATITGLSSTTTYDYTVQSTTTDPSYDCFPTRKGSFTTSSCEDVPTISSATATASSITVNWDCENATATLHVYSDEACTSEVDSKTVTAKTATIDDLERKTKYYYKVITAGGCPSLVNEITTEEININITDWTPTSITFDFNDDIEATIFLEGRQSEQTIQTHYAEGLFFSKYFEAGGNNKMLAVYNGTKDKINLDGYFIQSCSNSGRLMLNQFGRYELGWIYPQEEIILGVYDADNSAASCADGVEGSENWYTHTKEAGTAPAGFEGALSFGGRTSIALYYTPSAGDTTMIDIIGAYYVNSGLSVLDRLARINKDKCGVNSGAYLKIDDVKWNDQCSFWTMNGDNVNTAMVETNYPISTNRCLLVRKNTVVSGAKAVATNRIDNDTLNYTSANHCTSMPHTFKTLSTEWSGYRIGAGASAGQDLIDSTCVGFADAGKFDYNLYYVQYDTLVEETELGTLRNEDGEYVITGLRLDTLYCGDLRIDIKDKSTSEVHSSTFKVPLMVTENITTNNSVFTSGGRTAKSCETCDLVIMSTGTLTKATDGSSGDVPKVRNVKVYPGGKLIVPDETNYTVNSLALRRQEDVISMADIQGGLTVSRTNGVFLDLRIDPTNWHYVSLPYDCNVSDITFSDGTPAVLGTDYLIAWYDGAYRAANKDGGWTDVASGTTLKKGLGYIVSLPGSGTHKKELRFPMANGVIADEKTNKSVGSVYGYGGNLDDETLTPNHKGWNLIGNPYMMYYATDLTEPLEVGQLEKDGLTYKRTGSLRYLVTPNVDGGGASGWSGYSQVPINTHMKPFTAYFVQIGGANPATPQSISFNSSSAGKNSIVRRRMPTVETEDNHPVWYGIELVASDAQKDNTTLLISNDFTNEYDMMDDLVKMRGRYYKYSSVTTAPVLASRNAKEELAFNALPDSSAAVAGVPLNYYAAKAGTYTIRTDSRYDLEEVKSAMLHDVTNNTWTDLLENNYEFYSDKGDNTNRFMLYVRVERKKAPEVATGNDNLLDGKLSLIAIDKTLVLSGLTDAADIYVYDMSGKLLTGEHANGAGIWRATVPSTGVYFVRVNGAAGQQTLRTIVK